MKHLKKWGQKQNKRQSILKTFVVIFLTVFSPLDHIIPQNISTYLKDKSKLWEIYETTVPLRLFAIQLRCWVYKDITILGEFA